MILKCSFYHVIFNQKVVLTWKPHVTISINKTIVSRKQRKTPKWENIYTYSFKYISRCFSTFCQIPQIKSVWVKYVLDLFCFRKEFMFTSWNWRNKFSLCWTTATTLKMSDGDWQIWRKTLGNMNFKRVSQTAAQYIFIILPETTTTNTKNLGTFQGNVAY